MKERAYSRPLPPLFIWLVETLTRSAVIGGLSAKLWTWRKTPSNGGKPAAEGNPPWSPEDGWQALPQFPRLHLRSRILHLSEAGDGISDRRSLLSPDPNSEMEMEMET